MKAHPDVNDTLQKEGPDAVRARHDGAHGKINGKGDNRQHVESKAEAPRLRAAHNVARKWLDKEYDIDVLDTVLAAGASERLTGDPLWLLVISGPGNAKTETVQTLAGAGAHVTSTIASEGALLSATSRKSKAKGATGGLLRKLGDRGILVIKDVTSILSADRHTRGPVLAALREIHDGRYERNVGSDGGAPASSGTIAARSSMRTRWKCRPGSPSSSGSWCVGQWPSACR
jgi:hypothetical protein